MERSPSDWSLNDGQDEVLYGIALNEQQAREMVDGIQEQLHTVTLEETEAQVRPQDTAGPLPPPVPSLLSCESGGVPGGGGPAGSTY